MQSTSQYHVFSLPPAIVDALIPRNLINQPPQRAASPPPQPAPPIGPRACNICQGASLVGVDEQRAHFRSDWHRYNVKIRLGGGSPVTEPTFAQLVNTLENSLSGSASSDEDESADSDAVATLVSRVRMRRSSSPSTAQQNAPQTALVWFHAPPATQIGVYKALFPMHVEPAAYLNALKNMQRGAGVEGRKWALFMVAGGHFAGAVVRVSKVEDEEGLSDDVRGKKKPKGPKPDTEVLKHKTFHRYTTRRKQGGSQSINDNAKGNAKSAGAQLRRYGEQALRDDIRNLLDDWADEINDCERIWIRASGSNRKIFIDYDNAIIAKGDERLRTFPFPTRRPTQSELSRCLLELTRAKVSHLTEEELRTQDEEYLASLPKPKAVPTVALAEPEKPKAPRISKEEEAFRDKWSRILDMVAKGRIDPLKDFWEREGASIGGINATIPEWAGERRASLLQVAAHAGHEDVVRWLLEEARADPTIDVPLGVPSTRDDDGSVSDALNAPTRVSGMRRAAYDLARTREVRNVFRRCAAAHPEWWDWFGAARVPSALSRELEEEQEQKKKMRRKGLKDRVKEREALEREKEKERPPPRPVVAEVKAPRPQETTGPRKLGGAAGSSDGVAGLTPEMRAKVERERRARAAEARLKALK